MYFFKSAITIIALSSKLLNYSQTKKGHLRPLNQMKWKNDVKIGLK